MSEHPVVLTQEDMDVFRAMVANIHLVREVDIATIWTSIIVFCQSQLADPEHSLGRLVERPAVERIEKEAGEAHEAGEEEEGDNEHAGMKVRELIAVLGTTNPNADVFVALFKADRTGQIFDIQSISSSDDEVSLNIGEDNDVQADSRGEPQ